jgi:hypothetical protein
MDDFSQTAPKRRQVFRPVGEGKKVSVTPMTEARPTRLSVEPRPEATSTAAPATYEKPAARPLPANKLPKAPQAPVTAENLRHLQQLRDLSNEDLFALAEDLAVKDPTNLRRFELMFRIAEKVQKVEGGPQNTQKVEIRGDGVLDIVPDGFGFLRAKENSYTGTPEDVYVSPA